MTTIRVKKLYDVPEEYNRALWYSISTKLVKNNDIKTVEAVELIDNKLKKGQVIPAYRVTYTAPGQGLTRATLRESGLARRGSRYAR